MRRAITRRSPSRKRRFAMAIENFLDAHARRPFDFIIGIDEGQAEPRGQPAADGRLADAHQTHQDQRRFDARFGIFIISQHDERGYTAACACGNAVPPALAAQSNCSRFKRTMKISRYDPVRRRRSPLFGSC